MSDLRLHISFAAPDARHVPGPTLDSSPAPRAWWERPDLHYQDSTLRLAGHDLAALAASTHGPVYAYSSERALEKLAVLRGALTRARLRHRVFYAMKANRHRDLLALFAHTPGLGIDCCSPAELELALACGFVEEDVSYTSTSVSDADLARLARHPRVVINCDTISQIRRLARLCPGRRVGLRINPGIGVAYRDVHRLAYAGPRTTKFGIYEEQFDEALRVAREGGLVVAGLHCHFGWGVSDAQLPTLTPIFERIHAFVERVGPLEYLNLGGGFGTPLLAGDPSLDLDRLASLVARAFGGLPAELQFEPGDFLVRDSGVLLTRVNVVERKRDRLFVFVDTSFAVNLESAHYGLRHEIVPVVRRDRGAWPAVTIAGNVNESIDLFAEDLPFPVVEEGDYLALLHAGAYGASMSSSHCLRGGFTETVFPPHAPVQTPPR